MKRDAFGFGAFGDIGIDIAESSVHRCGALRVGLVPREWLIELVSDRVMRSLTSYCAYISSAR